MRAASTLIAARVPIETVRSLDGSAPWTTPAAMAGNV